MKGSAEDQYQLFKLYTEGKGVRKDLRAAFAWVMRAAEQDHIKAQFDLAKCYVKGIGVNANWEAAFECFKKLAEKGIPRALFLLGYCYKNGYGVNADERKWLELLEKAAAKGDKTAIRYVESEKRRMAGRAGALYAENDDFLGWNDPYWGLSN